MRPSLRVRQRISQRNIVVASASVAMAVMLLVVFSGSLKTDIASAAAGKEGAVIITSSATIVNEYTTLTANATSGSMSVSVAASSLNFNNRFPSALSAGDLIMVIQMQGATINTTNSSSYGAVTAYNNCGSFEFAEVSAVPGNTTIQLSQPLKNSYSSAGRTQVIRIPRYSSLLVNANASITCQPWNGTTGGIASVESNGPTTIHGSIDVSGKGFRGGSVEQSTQTPGEHSDYRSTAAVDGAEKGESIAGLPSTFSSGRYGRGAPANGGGGGNSHNAGGGGGANAGTGTWNGKGKPENPNEDWTTAWNLEGGNFSINNSPGGGRGGYSWSSAYLNPVITGINNSSWDGDGRYNVGGLGGRPLDYSTGRIYMGGGGGAGDSNNGVGTPGGNGGGIIYIISAGEVTGTGSINANGGDVPLSSGTPGDAGGGGGGGGTVIIYTKGASVSSLTITASGGAGGSQNLNNGAEVEGPGGGGGGGYVSTTSNANLSINVGGGMNGTTNAPAMTSFAANGATAGAQGITSLFPANPYSGTSTLPVELIAFSGKAIEDHVLLEWNTSSEKDNDYFMIERSSDGSEFTEIAKIKGSGNTSTGNAYLYKDKNPDAKNYYRLSQTDYNGRREYFKPVFVRFEKALTESINIRRVMPNPFSSTFTIHYYNSEAQAITMKLVTTNGRQAAEKSIFAGKGYHSLEWDTDQSVAPGIYYLYIYTGDQASSVMKVIKNQ